jgi:hypothetical protein
MSSGYRRGYWYGDFQPFCKKNPLIISPLTGKEPIFITHFYNQKGLFGVEVRKKSSWGECGGFIKSMFKYENHKKHYLFSNQDRPYSAITSKNPRPLRELGNA